MKHLICIETPNAEYTLHGIGMFKGHYMTAGIYDARHGGGDLMITSKELNPYIMRNLGDNEYMAYGCNEVYKHIKIPKRVVRAFKKSAMKHWKMSKKEAGHWARNVADSYFYCNGELRYFLIDKMMENYSGTYCRSDFDDSAEYEIRCW
ncbi:hypothetical protein HOS16_gp52 [Shigella phage vB_SflS-ISF001]|uniref:Uncharacterized protein n=1 Tax=Shigella phage vB_SflS-ISF001 TaxID=2048005 RepID=A0A2D1GQ51_9CAUD|nr:hypothetical protein HOS16_gp52 [Shigella phage vB_SflS-ISF001]ATN94130.1 hypothetical protein FLXISF001_052 [Shigella phage vB_SflS-ISF001]